jgi:hypothetical protein
MGGKAKCEQHLVLEIVESDEFRNEDVYETLLIYYIKYTYIFGNSLYRF